MSRAIKASRRFGFLGALLASAAMLASAAAPASAAPAWRVDALSASTAQPGGTLEYRVQFTNTGDEDTSGTITMSGQLPPGITVAASPEPVVRASVFGSFFEQPCTQTDGSPLTGGESELKCEVGESLPSPANSDGNSLMRLLLTADVDPLLAEPGETLTASFAVEGGGGAPASNIDPVRITEALPGFGIDAFDGLASKPDGSIFTQGGGHPYELATTIDFNTYSNPEPFKGPLFPVEATRDVVVNLPEGFVGNPTVAESCTLAELTATPHGDIATPTCPTTSQVGTTRIRIDGGGALPSAYPPLPLYNMAPRPGSPARFGFSVLGSPIVLDVSLRPDYRLAVKSTKISQVLGVGGTTVTFWGIPAESDPSHDPERACPGGGSPSEGNPTCASGGANLPFFRMPTSCNAPGEGMRWDVGIDSWDKPGALTSEGEPDLSGPNWKSASYDSHEPPGYPASDADPTTPWGPERGIEACDSVPVKGSLSATPSALDTETSSGLAVRLEVPNPGLTNPKGIASSDIEAVKVSLPQGVTINPSQAEGLGVCSSHRFESTELSFHPDGTTGCPADSKIGSVEVRTPLLEETLPGSVYIAAPSDNPFSSLLAIYIVIEDPQRGILIKLAGEVKTDAATGQIITTFKDLPQLPFSSFDFRFREGARAPLITPPTCGTYTTVTEITGHSDPANPITTKSSFQITRGIGGGPCPSGGVPPFKPGFQAGSVNPSAGAFTPFVMRLTRADGEQDMTKFSSFLPPGVSAKIAGVAKCSEAAIASAKAKTGLAEKASPSCPLNSQIGRTLVGAGVGSVLTYVPGSLYLAGPYNGAPLSVVSITPAVAGPFDVGVVIVREALTLDPRTAEVHVDGDRSDPIPHILEGIPLKLRDLRVYVDRPNFTINPTSCDPSAVGATLFGSFADVFNPADDVPVALSSRFQAANCASLGFKPRLSLKLKGGVKRGAHPALRALFRPRKGDANLERTVVKLPRSAFLDQAHIRTICTRVQFAADSCPPGAIYGQVSAFTPLLDEPLKGPAYLRSSNNKLPDLVFDLHGVVDIETSARIDSVRGGIRATFPFVPDAPLSKVIVEMQGGKKGLIVNSRNLCAAPSRAEVKLDGHNGKVHDFNPLVKPRCGKKHRRASATGRPSR